MNRLDIQKAVLESIRNTMGEKDLRDIHDDMSDFDSLDIIEIVMSIEDSVDVEIKDDDVEDFTTINDVIDYVDKAADHSHG